MKTLILSDRQRHVLIQPCLAMLYLWFTLFLLDEVSLSHFTWAAGASSLASSAFIVFARPDVPAAKPFHIFGGYALCVVVGIFFHYLHSELAFITPEYTQHIFELVCALAIGMSIMLMVIFRVGHPPAVGMTLILVLEPWEYPSLCVIVFAVLVLIFMRAWFKDYLRNLG